MARAHPKTFEACFKTPAFPAINAGAANRKTCQNGKFHGMIASTVPRGSNATKLREASVATTSGRKKPAPFSA